MEAYEYAVRKDVKNNPIVREVDTARQRELWWGGGIGVIVAAAVLFSAWQHYELVQHGYQVERLKRERAAEEETARHLRLEIETLRSPKRIETLATEQLHLVAPSGQDAVVIERVVPSAPPARSVVARR